MDLCNKTVFTSKKGVAKTVKTYIHTPPYTYTHTDKLRLYLNTIFFAVVKKSESYLL